MYEGPWTRVVSQPLDTMKTIMHSNLEVGRYVAGVDGAVGAQAGAVGAGAGAAADGRGGAQLLSTQYQGYWATLRRVVDAEGVGMLWLGPAGVARHVIR